MESPLDPAASRTRGLLPTRNEAGEPVVSSRSITWRLIVFFMVLALGFTSMLLGADVSERALAGEPTLVLLYYSLGLFVMGGMDLGTPSSGPAIARGMLWVAYFLAPTVTAFALLETLLRLLAPLTLRMRRLRDHTVVAGCSRLAGLYLQRLRELDARAPVVLVEVNAQHPRLPEVRAHFRATVVHGDIRSRPTVLRLQLSHARRVLLLTGDDFANLDAAARILEHAPALAGRVEVHISDIGLLRTLRQIQSTPGCEFFNAHQIAAEHLVREHLIARFHSTPQRDLVVLAGFGRFGQTVLDQLQQHATDCFGEVIILDLQATRLALGFADQVGFRDGYERELVDDDLTDPRVWERLEQAHSLSTSEPVLIIGAGDDSENLRVALRLASRYPEAYIVARSFHRSRFAEKLARHAGIKLFAVAELITQGIPEDWCSGVRARG